MKSMYLMGAAAVVLMAPVAAEAQQITSGIEGRVSDSAGAPVSGATVTITDTRTNSSRTLTTGESGRFALQNLTVGGPYTVTATAPGLEGQTVNDVNIAVQGNTSLTFQLQQGAGDIVVTASRVNVVQLAVGPGTGFGQDVIDSAPSFDRDIRDVIRIDPRVTLDRDSSSGQDRISCLGGNDRSNAFTVDGISQGDLYGLNGNGFASRSSTPIPYSAIRQTSVEFAPFDVEYGQFTGCAINVITRSGGNKFHGSAFFEYSDNGLRGTKVANSSAAPVEAQKNWGVSLGGPIIKDRLFFFGAYSHQETGYAFDFGPAGAGYPNETAGVTQADFDQVTTILKNVYGIDTGGLVRNLPYKNDRYFGRLDWQINDRHRLEGTYQHLDESTMKRGDIYTSTSSPTLTGANNFYNSGTKSDYYSARLYSDWSDSFSTEIRYAHSKIQDIQDPVGGGEAQFGNPIPRIIVGTYNSGIYGTINAGPDQYRTANDLRTTVDTATFIAKLSAGNHQFKFGGGFNQVGIFNLFVPNATATLVFANISDLQNGILSNGNRFTFYGSSVTNGQSVGAYGNYAATGDVNDAAAAFTRTIFSAFAQDDWQISDNLSMVAGLRIDWYDGGRPGFNPNFFARYGRSNSIGFSNLGPSIMPRVAFTYDAGDFAVFSRSKFRLGAGLFSGGDPLVWFGNAFQNNGITYSEGSLLSSACSGLSTPVSVVSGGTFTGVPACLETAGSSDAARGLGDTQSIDPNIKTPSVLRVNLGWDTDLDFAPGGFFSGWHMKVDYIYSRFINPFGLSDLSQTIDFRKGLNGYTIDGRPIYAAIDPTVAGCNATLVSANPNPVYNNVTTACFSTGRDDELMLTNTDGYTSQSASFILTKHANSGIFTSGGAFDFSIGYAYTDGHDRRAMTSSTAGSNYDVTAAFDRQNPAEGRAIYSNTHSIALRTVFTEELFGDLKTKLGLTFTAHSGRPYSLTFSGGSVFNDSASGSDNALVYIPTGAGDPNIAPEVKDSSGAHVSGSYGDAAQALSDYARTLNCAKKYIGKSIARNTCDNDWYFDLDLTFSQELPGPGRLFGLKDKIRVYATVDNFLNMLDKNWNVLRQRHYAGLQDIASISGIDSQGRYIISGFNGASSIAADNQLNTNASVWRVKLGVSYNF